MVERLAAENIDRKISAKVYTRMHDRSGSVILASTIAAVAHPAVYLHDSNIDFCCNHLRHCCMYILIIRWENHKTHCMALTQVFQRLTRV